MDSTTSNRKPDSQEAQESSQLPSSMLMSDVDDPSSQQDQSGVDSPYIASRSSPTEPMASLSLVSRSRLVAIAPQGTINNTEVSQHKQKELRVDLSENVSSSAHTQAPDPPDSSIENQQAAAAPKHHETRSTQAQEGVDDGAEGTDASMDAVQDNQAVGDAPKTVAVSDSTLSPPDLSVPCQGAFQVASKESRSHYYDEYESHLHLPRRRRAGRRSATDHYSLDDQAGQKNPEHSHHASKTQPTVHAERAVSEGGSREDHVSVCQSPPGPPLSSLSLYPPESDTHAHRVWRSPPSPQGDLHLLQLSSTHPADHEYHSTLHELLPTSRNEGLLPPLPLTPLNTSDLFRAHWSSRVQHSPAISLSPEDPGSHQLWLPSLPQEVDHNPAQSRRIYSSMPLSVQEPGGDTPLDVSSMDGSGAGRNIHSLANTMQRSQRPPHADPLYHSGDRTGDQAPLRAFGTDGLPSLAPRPRSAVGGAMLMETASSAQGLQPIQYRPPYAGEMDGQTEHALLAREEQSNTSALKAYPTARVTVKGPLPIDVQIKLLSNVLHHDPFNCPIRRTTQVWECIAKEQGMRARTCARRFDNIIQSSIAGRERAIGTEEQIATKKQLLEQLLEMMNQPQAKVRMQKKRRYRSEKADRQLLLETIRFNPFAQKIGQVAKAWEDVRDALNMKVHSRQCIRRVNRIIKPYLLRERMYKGDIPEEMQEENDDLVKQVIQLMHQSGQADSLEDDEGHSNDEESALSGGYETDDQDYPFMETEARHRRDKSQQKDSNKDNSTVVTSAHMPSGTLSPLMLTSDPPVYGSVSLTPSTTVAMSASRQGRARRPRQGSPESTKKASLDPPESEFRPQRIWGSHPYSRGILSRSSSASSRVAHATHFRSSSEHEPQPFRSPLAESIQRPTLPSPTVSSTSTAAPSHGALTSREGSVTWVGNEASTQVYRAILGELQMVKRYFSQLEGQRQRDKDNQKALYTMMSRMQQQMHLQHRSIEGIQQHLLLQQGRLDDGPSSAGHERPQQDQSLQHAVSDALSEASPSAHD